MSNACRYDSTTDSFKDGFHFEGLESTGKYAVRPEEELWLKQYSWSMELPHHQCNSHRITWVERHL